MRACPRTMHLCLCSDNRTCMTATLAHVVSAKKYTCATCALVHYDKSKDGGVSSCSPSSEAGSDTARRDSYPIVCLDP